MNAIQEELIAGKRNYGLDIIRAISIILVILSHTFEFDHVELGVMGVEVFFVLSGFLVGQILIRDFSKSLSVKTLINFWKRRWFRTLPLYYLILTYKIFFTHNPYGLKSIVYYFFLQNNFVGIYLMGVSWSLVIEEWFYLTVPIIILFVFRGKSLQIKKFLYLIVTLLFLIGAIRFLWVAFSNRPYESIRGNFPFRLDSLLFGVLLAHIKLNFPSFYQLLNKKLLFGIGSILLFSMVLLLGGLNTEYSFANNHLWTRTIWFTITSLSISLIIPYVESKAETSFLKKSKFLYVFFTTTSILTYALYLLHMEVFHIPLPKIITDYIALKVLCHYFLLFAFAYLIYIFYEHPMTSLRDKIKLFKRAEKGQLLERK